MSPGSTEKLRPRESLETSWSLLKTPYKQSCNLHYKKSPAGISMAKHVNVNKITFTVILFAQLYTFFKQITRQLTD